METTLPASLTEFYKAHPDFSVSSTNLLDQQVVTALGLDANTLDALRTWQRVVRIAPDSTSAKVLYDNGIGSAQQLTAMSKTTFLTNFASKLSNGDNGSAVANEVYDKALLIKDQTMHMMASVHSVAASPHFKTMAVNHIGDAVPDYFETLSDYQQIFGSLDFCSCSECRSIFGAAAYFVDLMRIIDKAVTVPNTKIPSKLTLKSRRPDLWQLELTCANTTTMVPYLQIVNEVLENTVINILSEQNPDTNPVVWQTMANAVFPVNTPFNLPLSQVRALLAQFGATLASVFAVFDPDQKDPLGMSVETLNLSYERYQFAKTSMTDSATLSAAYGTTINDNDNGGLDRLKTMLRQTSLDRPTFLSLLMQNLSEEERAGVAYTYTPSQFGTRLVLVFYGNAVVGSYDHRYGKLKGTLAGNVISGTWSEASQDAPDNAGSFVFTLSQDRSSFTGKWMHGYDSKWESSAWNGQQTGTAQTMTLAHQLFINQGQPGNTFMDIVVNNTDPNNPYEQISNLTHDTLDRLARFSRLATTIGWDYDTLDWLMASLGYTAINDSLMIDLAGVKQLAARLNISPVVLSACWFDIKTRGMGDEDESIALFDTIFNTPSLIRNGTTLDYYHPITITSGTDKNATFLNPTYQDIPANWIANQSLFDISKKPDPASLTYGKRIVSGIQATNDELAALADFFFPGQAFIALGVSNLSILYRHAMLPRQLGMPIADYLVLLRLLNKNKSVTLSISDIGDIADAADWVKSSGFNVYELDYLINANTSLYVNTGYTNDSLVSFLKSLMVRAQTMMVRSTDFISNNNTAAVSSAFYDYFKANNFVNTDGVVLSKLSDTQKGLIKSLTLPDGTAITPVGAQLNDAQQKINELFTAQQDAIYGAIAGFFGVNDLLTRTLCNGILTIQKIPSVVAMFITDNAKNGDTMKAFILMFAQHAILAKRLALTPDELSNVYQYPSAYLSNSKDVFNFLPLTLTNLKNIRKMKQLVLDLQDTRNQFISYLAVASGGTVTPQNVQDLCTLTGWSVPQCTHVCTILFGKDRMCQTVTQLYQVNNCFKLGKQIGIDMYALYSLVHLQLLTADDDNNWKTFTDCANALTGALRAYYGNDAWSTMFQQYNGPILELQRDVLEAFCLWQIGLQYTDITTSRNLYEFLLIDVDMGGCNQVSYIRQALNTAQLYLQRCRLNLERNVSISTDDIPESWWSWLLNYRVWEANRQVFLYPENYLDPSLRKTKTALFKQLENDLSQVEITKPNVDQVYKKYLDNFAALAKLQFVDACQYTVHDPNLGAADTLFLFARTQTDPATYYYVTRQSGSVWSDWKKIDVTIPSSTINPVYVFNRLFIFWSEIAVTHDNDPTSTNANDKCTVVKASIKYSFIDFSGNWTQPQPLVSDQVINVTTSKTDLHSPFDASLFDLNKPYWNKIDLTPVSIANFTDPVAGRLSGEKLVVSFGPLLSVTATATSLNAPANVPVNQADITKFERSVFDAVSHFNQLHSTQQVSTVPHASVTGQVPLMGTTVMDGMLNPSWLINQSEFIFLEDDHLSDDTRSVFQAGFDVITGSLIVLPANNTIAINYKEGMNLGAMLAVPPSRATEQSFISSTLGIDKMASALYYEYLKGANTIDANGKITDDIQVYSISMIEAIVMTKNPAKCRYILDVLLQLYYGSPVLLGTPQAPGVSVLPVRNAAGAFLFAHPAGTFLLETSGMEITNCLQVATAFGWVGMDAFVNPGLGIDSKASQTIFINLQAENVNLVDRNGIVNLDTTIGLKPDIIANWLQTSYQNAQWVLNILLSSGRTSLQYTSDQADADFSYHTMKFTSTRLTTGAVQDLSKRLFAQGIDGLLQLDAQMAPVNVGHCFGDFNPGPQVIAPEAFYDNQVAFTGPYGYYYWELFYYAPTLIAAMLKHNQQFSDAEKWYQYVFNPTLPPSPLNENSFINNNITKAQSAQFFTALTNAGYVTGGKVTTTGNTATVDSIAATLNLNLQPRYDLTGKNLRTTREVQNMLQNAYLIDPLGRYWQFKPFRNHTIESLVSELQDEAQTKIYNDDPFDPDAIARLRIGAYEKNLVMQYIDNLIAWGDMEFTQYTWETITTATMLYVYAYDLLGPRPQNLGPCTTQPSANFETIQQHYAGPGIPQFLIDLENTAGGGTPIGRSGIAYNDLDVYFGIPENDQFLGYWDKVEDRLYKIRHCLNIKGQAQPLPLFDPPIDPMQLVKAAAASNGVLNTQSLFQPAVPYYRFSAVLSRTYSITNAVIQLGSLLLSALEKNDAEGLSLLNSTQQITLLNMMTLMKQKQIEVQTDTISSLNESLQNAQNRQNYYTNLINAGLISKESTSLLLSAESIPPQVLSMGIKGIAIAGYLAPDIFGFADGGMQFGEAINMGAQISDNAAAIINQSAAVLNTMAQYERRNEEWTFQQQTAQFEVAQLTQQIAGANAQLNYYQQDLAAHLKNIEQVTKVDAYLRGKFTNQELYQWVIGRISSLFYSSYQMAVSMALSAQAAYQYELDNSDTFISYSYWDSLRKGLLSGESLLLSLQQMEQAYLAGNSRSLEIEKTISLRQEFPAEFLKFKWGHGNGKQGKQGEFNFTLGERMFDFDFPGHYRRKIKTISVSIPAVISPYQNLNATLTQTSNAVLLKANSSDVSPVKYLINNTSLNPGGDTPAAPASDVLRSNWMPNQQIAISGGSDDSGVFQLDFNDERYLPFEGTGAVSGWTLRLPPETNRINFDSISDVILKVRYTAIDGGSVYASSVKNLYQGAYPQFRNLKAKYMDMKQTYSSAWFQMFATPPSDNAQTISFKVTDDYVLTTLKNIQLSSVMIQLELAGEAGVTAGTKNEFVSLTLGKGKAQPIAVTDNFGELVPEGVTTDAADVMWQLTFDLSKTPSALLNDDQTKKALDPSKFLNMALVIVYKATAF